MDDSYVYAAWYFDGSNRQRILYGLTVWLYNPKECKFTLAETETDRQDASSLIAYVGQATFPSGKLTHLIDDCLEMSFIYNALKQNEELKGKLHLVTREGSGADQVIQARSLLNTDRYHVSDTLLIEPDLIFPDIPLENLIDPVVSDEPMTYPLTQSLCVAMAELPKRHSLAYGSIYRVRSSIDFSGYGGHYGRSLGNYSGW